MKASEKKAAAELAAIHAAALAASVPASMRWVNATTVAAALDYSKEHFLQRIACLPDFPAARDFGGNPRWLLSDVQAWAAARPPAVRRRRAA